MSNCFTLTRKGESKPANLQEIDDEMRQAFGEEPNKEQWLWEWYNEIGLGLALGRDWNQLRDQYSRDENDDEDSVLFCQRMQAVVDWLEANFTSNAWAERG